MVLRKTTENEPSACVNPAMYSPVNCLSLLNFQETALEDKLEIG
jgi:hypothetical protein